MFDAVNIEYAFAFLLERTIGGRGGPHDADIFRHGDAKDLGKLLQKTAEHLRLRVDKIKFAPEALEKGGAKIRIDVAIDQLENLGVELMSQNSKEPNDYHWSIIAEFVFVIGGLLDHLENKSGPR